MCVVGGICGTSRSDRVITRLTYNCLLIIRSIAQTTHLFSDGDKGSNWHRSSIIGMLPRGSRFSLADPSKRTREATQPSRDKKKNYMHATRKKNSVRRRLVPKNKPGTGVISLLIIVYQIFRFKKLVCMHKRASKP